jgi:death on curing protein
MKPIGLAEALAIHTEVVNESGGSHGLRDQGGLESALARPYMTFDQTELYPEPVDKAAAILESIVINHPFVDGNKRAGYSLMRLTLNTFELDVSASDDEEYDLVIAVATSQMDVDAIRAWLQPRIVAF